MEKGKRHISDSLQSGISLFCSTHPEVAAVFLFGSQGTPQAREASDIDLALLFSPGKVPDLHGEMQLADELSRIFKRDDIDLVVLDKAPLFLGRRVVMEGAIIQETDYIAVSDFLERVFRFGPDYEYRQRQFYREYDAALKEAYSRNMVDREIIRRKLNLLEENRRRLRELEALSEEVFLKHFYYVASAKYLLQTSIEGMLDVGNHIIARERLRAPETSAEVFTVLVETGFLPADKESDFRNMAKFRNRVVHLYHDIDDREIYRLIPEGLSDIDVFVAGIVEKIL